MGRHNGSWAKFHPQMRDHAKTRAAVRVLVEGGLPAEFAYPIVLAAVPALAAWALSDGDTGRTGGLSDARFLAEAWPESAESPKWRRPGTGALLRRALAAVPAGHASGFLEGEGEAERIHDFGELYADVLRHRARNRSHRSESAATPGLGTPDAVHPGPGATPGAARSDTAACAQPARSATEAPPRETPSGLARAHAHACMRAGAPGARPRAGASAADVPPSAGESQQGVTTAAARSLRAGCGVTAVPTRASGSGSGSGSGNGRGSGAEPSLAPLPADPEPTIDAPPGDAGRTAAASPPPDAPLARRLDALAEGIHRATGAPPTFARTVLGELVDRVEGDVAFVERHLLEHPLARGADVPDWKRRVTRAWVDAGDRARLERAERGAEVRHGEHATEAAAAAEFAASGYTDRVAWSRDRASGQLRTGPSAARRKFVLGEGVVDVEPVRAGA